MTCVTTTTAVFRTAVAAAGLAAVAVSSGCASCNEASCISQLTVQPHPTTAVEVCIAEACTEVPAGDQPVSIPIDDIDADSLEVSVASPADGSQQQVTVALDQFRPNGPDCGPVCTVGELDLRQT